MLNEHYTSVVSAQCIPSCCCNTLRKAMVSFVSGRWMAILTILYRDDLDGGGGVSSGGRHNDNGDMLLDYTIINACCN